MTREDRARRLREEVEASSPGPAADGLPARLWHLDRAGRFERRLAAIRRHRASAEVRRRTTVAVAVGAALAAAGGAGWLVAGPGGLFVGLAAVGVLAAGMLAVPRIAARRGARAWDWQAGRHRLFGDPSRSVQMLDQPQQE